MQMGQTNGDFQGFVAEHYDLWFSPSNNSLDYVFYKGHVIANQGPAVEIGCGTGRLLLPFIQEGLDVDGVDYSEDMLKVCKIKAEQLGVTTTLYHQSIQQLDLPRQYQTIFIPGNTFNLLTDRLEAIGALKRMYSHLTPGGQLLLTLSVPFKYMLNAKPDDWKVLAEVAREDGAVIRLSERVAIAYWEQLKTNYNKYEVFKDNKLVEVHDDTIQVRWFYQFEFELMLSTAEFKEIEFTYTQADRAYMMVSARK